VPGSCRARSSGGIPGSRRTAIGSDDLRSSSVQPIARYRDSRRPAIGNDMLNLARKIGSHCIFFFQRYQGQDCEKDDTSPSQEQVMF